MDRVKWPYRSRSANTSRDSAIHVGMLVGATTLLQYFRLRLRPDKDPSWTTAVHGP